MVLGKLNLLTVSCIVHSFPVSVIGLSIFQFLQEVPFLTQHCTVGVEMYCCLLFNAECISCFKTTNAI